MIIINASTHLMFFIKFDILNVAVPSQLNMAAYVLDIRRFQRDETNVIALDVGIIWIKFLYPWKRNIQVFIRAFYIILPL